MNEQVRPDEASSALAAITQAQEQVIDAVLPPTWYWWWVAAACVAIGAAVDSHNTVVRAIVLPVAISAVVAVSLVMILGFYRRVRVRSSELLNGPGAVAIVFTVWIVVGVTIGAAFGLRAAGSPLPATIATIIGGVLLVAIGPVLRRILRRIMLGNAAGANR